MTLFLMTIVLLTVVLIISLYTYQVAFYSPKGKHSTIEDPLEGSQYDEVSEHIYRISHIMERIPCESIKIRSFDGCMLHGRYYHISDDAPIEILFHGYRSCALRDCSGGHALSRKMGFNALVVDQRAHGKSGGKTITFGIKEHRACLCWIQYCNDRFGGNRPIILSGLSMGAATVLMAAKRSLPDNVCCMIADSPYSAPSEIIEKVCADMHYPVLLCRPFIHLGALIFGHFRLNALTAKEAVQHARVPILLIHGEDDHFVPCSMSYDIAQHSSAPVRIETFPHADHGLSYLVDPLRYEYVIYDFLRSIPALADQIPESFHNQFFPGNT